MVIGFAYDNVRPRKRDGRTQTTFSVAKVSPQIVTHLLWASFAWFRVCLLRGVGWPLGPGAEELVSRTGRNSSTTPQGSRPNSFLSFRCAPQTWALARGSSSVWPPASRCEESCQIRFFGILLNRLPCRKPGKGRRYNLSQTRTLSSRFGTAATATWAGPATATWDLPPNSSRLGAVQKTDKVGSFTS